MFRFFLSFFFCSDLRHENLVGFVAMMYDPLALIMVSHLHQLMTSWLRHHESYLMTYARFWKEIMPDGGLDSFLKKNGTPGPATRLRLALDIAQGTNESEKIWKKSKNRGCIAKFGNFHVFLMLWEFFVSWSHFFFSLQEWMFFTLTSRLLFIAISNREMCFWLARTASSDWWRRSPTLDSPSHLPIPISSVREREREGEKRREEKGTIREEEKREAEEKERKEEKRGKGEEKEEEEEERRTAEEEEGEDTAGEEEEQER